MKLISMTEFVLAQREKRNKDNIRFLDCEKYANFLNQPLTLGMFIPCDEDGNVLEKHFDYDDWLKYKDHHTYGVNFIKKCQEYQQAKDKVLFEGFFDTINAPQYSHYISDGMQSVFYMSKNGSTYKNILGMKKIEDLTNKTPIILTPNAIKKLKL